ncbi:ABC transporter ATP-binding protein [Brevibacillus nitrificans]|uniref:ABC transporter ATP-binding protein n=1 Tax=Brevibacillus nitrificans TaxID=651560 RepID=UPI00260F263A|nr:ABC transporter ATP-binding protein [Brevibacillus nitrificans]
MALAEKMEETLSTNSSSVSMRDLVKTYLSASGEENYAVKHFSLDIQPGQLVTLLGPSGCGKTTTLRMLAGFDIPTSGQIRFGQTDVTFTPPNKRDIGMVFQSYALFPHLTIYENVAYGLQIKKVPKEELKTRVNRVLALMHLEEFKDRLPSQLSGGQQQRVALARAVVTEPKVLLFDEPLSNLDAKLREYMRDELRKLQQRLGITSLYVTHDQSEAMAISDQVVIMTKGVIQQVGSPHEIYTKPVNHFVADFMGKANFLTGKIEGREKDAWIVSLENNRILVKVDRNIPVQVADTVDCVVRPEFFTLDEQGEFTARLTRATYLGTYVEYEAVLGNQDVTFVDYAHHQHGWREAGTDVKLRLNQEAVRIIPARS